MALEKQIVPEEARTYEPIEKGRFHHPLVLRLLVPIMNLLQRKEEEEYVVRQDSDDQVIVRCKRSEERRVGKECRSRWSP